MIDWHPIYAAGVTDTLRVMLAFFVAAFVITKLIKGFRDD